MKLAGYCPVCLVPVGVREVCGCCAKCGTPLKRDSLKSDPAEPVARQTGKDLLKRNYKKMTKGVKNGGTIGHRPGVAAR